MSSWGPGSPESPLRSEEGAESESEEIEDQSPSEEQESPEERPERSEEPQSELYDFEQPMSPERFRGTSRDAIRPGEYAFLPVFGFNEANIAARKYTRDYGFEDDDTTINLREDEPLEIGGKELTWWEENSIMPQHPFMLVNPLGFASVDPDVHNFREVFRCSKGEQFVFSDSGGYQLMSMDDAEIVGSLSDHNFKEYRIYPERLIEWQTRNADAGATIDYPPYNISGDSSFPDAAEWGEEWMDFFEQRRDMSADMTARMAARLKKMRDDGQRQAQDFLFTPVIHGKPHPEDSQRLVKDWHESMLTAAESEGIAPGGWVLKPEPSSNFGQIAMFLGYAAEYLRGVEFVHVLMVGGVLQKTLLQYYAMKTGHFVTSDASSYAAGGMRRQFNLPGTANRRSVIISSRDEDDENAADDQNHLERYPCRCAVCSTVEQDLGFEFITEGSGSARSVSMNLHNLQQSLNIERTLDALLREEGIQLVETGGKPTGSEFWRLVSNIGQQKRVEDLYRAMDYVRLAIDEGLDVANKRYRILWNGSGGKTILPASGSAGADW